MTSSAGASLTWSEYYPYGQVRLSGAGAGTPAANPFAFTGEQRDGFTGLYHLRARQYDSGTGRFLTTDPLAPLLTDPFVASYVYVRDAATDFVDPSGRGGEGYFESLWHVARFMMNLPLTAIALPTSLMTGSNYCGLNSELVVECYENDHMPATSAITVGNVVTTAYTKQRYGNRGGLRHHENSHASQWLIPGFPVLYGFGMLMSQATTNDWFCGNPVERLAGTTEDYAKRCGW